LGWLRTARVSSSVISDMRGATYLALSSLLPAFNLLKLSFVTFTC